MHTHISYSIVIPMYNKANVVIDTLNSVREQTFRDFECVIVDDGSMDASVEVVEQYIENDARFRLIQKENGGVSSARNEGIRQAKKPYIAFLDADDLWDKHYLTAMSYLINCFPNSGIYGCGWRHVYGNFVGGGNFSNVNRGFCVQNVNYWNSPFTYTSSSVVIEKRVFSEVGCFDERISIGEDIDMWYRILLLYKGAYYQECLAYYRQDAENRLSDTKPCWTKHFVCYFDKWAKDRIVNEDFCYFIDNVVAPRLFVFLEDTRYLKDKVFRKQVKQVRQSLNKTNLSIKTIIRLYLPRMFYVYWFIKHKLLPTL